jgi:VWFA-related protein
MRSGRDLILSLLLVATAAFAQVRETITVEVVDVPVYVVAPDGKPVRGLTRDAFTLLVDGKPQPIEYFDAVDFGAARGPAEAAPRPSRERRLYLLLFDLTFKEKDVQSVAKVVRAQKAAEKAIEASNPATDLFAVATYSTNRGVYFATPFLSDRAAIKRALFTLRQSKAKDALGLEITEDERAMVDVLGEATDQASSEILDAIRGGQANQEMASAETARRIESQFDGLSEAAARLSGLEGQKHVLLFTEGFEAGLVHDIQRRFGGPPQVDARLMRILNEMYRKFQAAGVILDSVDIAGTRHTFNNLDNDALFMLARGTGGRVMQNRNDLSEAITDLTTTQQVVYLLGFRRRDDRAHRIDVRVNGAPRGSNLFYRTGFGSPTRPNVDALQFADIILNDVPQNGFTMDVAVAPAPGSASVAVSFPRAQVIPQLVEKSPYVDALLYVFNPQGDAVGFHAKRIAFEPGARENQGSVAFEQPFQLPPGKYVAKVLLHVAATNAMAYARREFTVEP